MHSRPPAGGEQVDRLGGQGPSPGRLALGNGDKVREDHVRPSVGNFVTAGDAGYIVPGRIDRQQVRLGGELLSHHSGRLFRSHERAVSDVTERKSCKTPAKALGLEHVP